MKKKPVHKFPQRIIKKKLSKIRNKYYNYSNNNDKTDINTLYTWAQCYHKAKGKLYYRNERFLKNDAKKDDKWISLIAFLKARLVQHYDELTNWRMAEYKILEKINKRDFQRAKSPNLIWYHIAINIAGKANKLYKRKPKTRYRSESYDWEDVVNSSKTRIKNYKINKKTFDEMFWELCFKANFEKIRSRVRQESWKACIGRNYGKLVRLRI